MDTKFYKNEKFQRIFYAVIYFFLAVAFIISGCFVFNRTYYTNIYISGSSMMPTLVGGSGNRWNYGISDNHEATLRNLKRFDVVITYYPSGWNGGDEDTTYKIKRLWGFPGETISLIKTDNTYTFTASKDNEIIYKVTANVESKAINDYGTEWKLATFNVENKTFNTHADTDRTFTEIKLSEEKQEYFVMGDNWSASSDSYSHRSSPARLTFDNLQGKMIAIQGTAKLVNGNLVDKKKEKDRYYF